jgi:hypothetical protein
MITVADGKNEGRRDIMNDSRCTLGRQAFKVVMVGIAASCLGAAVVAAPLSLAPRAKFNFGTRQLVEERTSFSGLAKGPAFQLERAGSGNDEDCVRVVRMTGPDGRVYVTRGLVCAD